MIDYNDNIDRFEWLRMAACNIIVPSVGIGDEW